MSNQEKTPREAQNMVKREKMPRYYHGRSGGSDWGKGGMGISAEIAAPVTWTQKMVGWMDELINCCIYLDSYKVDSIVTSQP